VIDLRGKKVVAFCGIGDPDSFFKMMENNNILMSRIIKFPDHHKYSIHNFTKIKTIFDDENADALLTTQRLCTLKNSEFVIETKSDNLYKQLLYNYPLYYAKIKMQITKSELLFSHLDKVVKLV
jgi:tetraacyldisaccharide 4'-kinase